MTGVRAVPAGSLFLVAAAVLQGAAPSGLAAQGSGYCELSVGIGVSGIDTAVPYRQMTGYVYAGVNYTWHYDDPNQEYPDEPPNCSSESQGIDTGSIVVTLNGTNASSQLPFAWYTGTGSSGYSATNASFQFIDDAVNTIIVSYGGLADTVSLFVEKYPRPARDVSMNNGENIDPSRCVAQCFEVVKTLTTPAYISRDVPRSVTLMYRSGRAAPRGHVYFDLTPTLTPKPVKARVRLNYKGATPNDTIPLVGGAYEQYFTVPTDGRRRYGVQFDADPVRGTGVYDVELRVQLYWADGAFRDLPVETVRVIIVDERNSVFGAGWLPTSIQRMKATNKGLLLTTGSGAALYFDSVGTVNNKTTYASPRGDFSRVIFDRGPGGKIRRDWADSSFAEFDPLTGRIGKIQDRFGSNTQFEYDPNNDRPLYIQDPAGERVWFGYESGADGWKVGTIRKIETSGGTRNTWMAVDQQNNFVHWYNILGNYEMVNAVYDANHKLTSYVDRGRTFSFTYDHTGRVASDSSPAIKLHTGAMRRLALKYESAEALVFPEPFNGTSGTPKVPPPFDAVGAHVSNLAGVSTAFVMNRLNAPIWIQHPRNVGVQTSIERNQHSQITKVTDGGTGKWYSYTWTGPSMTASTSSEGSQISYTYDPKFGLPLSTSGTTVPIYNWIDTTRGVVDSTRRGSTTGRVTRFSYDAAGRLSRRIDPDRRDTTTIYRSPSGLQNTDSVRTGRRLSRTIRDGLGRRTASVYPNGTRDSVVYDGFNRVLKAIDRLGHQTQFSYDSTFLVAVTDAKGQVYQFKKNALGMDTAYVDPRGLVTRYAFDSAATLRQATNRRGQLVSLKYDSLGRMIERIGATDDTVRFGYDPAGKWMSGRNQWSTDTIWSALDTSSRSVSVRSGVTYDISEVFRVDTRTAETTVRRLGSGGWAYVNGVAFDEQYRVSSISPAGANATSLQHDSTGVTATANIGGITSYAVTRRPTGTVGHVQNSLFASLGRGFVYDSIGKLAQSLDATGATGRLFQYDSAGRLKQWADAHSPSGGNCTIDTNEEFGTRCQFGAATSSPVYSYDQVGNRLGDGATYETGNRLVSTSDRTLSYDEDGNLVQMAHAGVQYTYWWNRVGQLDSASSSASGTVRFRYDAFGRRIQRASPQGTVQFLWADDHVIADVTQGGQAEALYTYYAGTDNLHSMVRPGVGAYFYLPDGRYSVKGVTNAAGTLVASYNYDPFGNTSAAIDLVPNRFRFAGREYEPELGLYFNRARYYSPSIGRFISEDPIGITGGMNTYEYAAGDPVNYTDPSGLCPFGDPNNPHQVPPGTVVRGWGGNEYECASNDNNWVMLGGGGAGGGGGSGSGSGAGGIGGNGGGDADQADAGSEASGSSDGGIVQQAVHVARETVKNAPNANAPQCSIGKMAHDAGKAWLTKGAIGALYGGAWGTLYGAGMGGAIGTVAGGAVGFTGFGIGSLVGAVVGDAVGTVGGAVVGGTMGAIVFGVGGASLGAAYSVLDSITDCAMWGAP